MTGLCLLSLAVDEAQAHQATIYECIQKWCEILQDPAITTGYRQLHGIPGYRLLYRISKSNHQPPFIVKIENVENIGHFSCATIQPVHEVFAESPQNCAEAVTCTKI